MFMEICITSTSTKYCTYNENAYKNYFGGKVGSQDKKWASHICYNSCITQLFRWVVGKQKKIPFAGPVIWREPTNHDADCYFCLTDIKGFKKKQI